MYGIVNSRVIELGMASRLAGLGRAARAWFKASRPASQLYILVPLLAGQLYARSAGRGFDWGAAALVHAFGLFLQLFIVYANDLADVATDRLNRTFTPFSGGSRVLVDGDLTGPALRRGAAAAALLSLASCATLGAIAGSWLPVALCALSLLMLGAYSYPPLRLNYRGGGELLQMLGTGLLLPVFGYVAQSGELSGFPAQVMAVLLPTALGCAVSTSLPDEISDRASGKRSATVLLGSRGAQLVTVLLHVASLATLAWMLAGDGGFGRAWLLVPGATAIAGQVACFGGHPGSRRLLLFGLASIAATLALTLASAGALAL